MTILKMLGDIRDISQTLWFDLHPLYMFIDSDSTSYILNPAKGACNQVYSVVCTTVNKTGDTMLLEVTAGIKRPCLMSESADPTSILSTLQKNLCG